MIRFFDGHNDFLTELWESEARRARWPGPSETGHLDLPRMRAGGFVGGFFAIWTPSDTLPDAPRAGEAPGPYDLPLAPPVPLREAQPIALAQAAAMLWMERQSGGAFEICHTGAALRRAADEGRIGGILHMEGAEPIDEDLDALHLFHAAGLRSLGPVWSRPNAFGHGVPFRYPGSPDTGAGLTDAGQRLVRACDALGVLLDLSHLNEAGFNDVARLSERPLIATHSNAHALCPVPRNLTDRQLAIIAERGGIVGLNFASAFLHPEGVADLDQGFDPMLRHLDHLLGILGEDGVALGSDFDGARVPHALGDVAGLPRLAEAMRAHGYGEALIAKIAAENWLTKLEQWLV